MSTACSLLIDDATFGRADGGLDAGLTDGGRTDSGREEIDGDAPSDGGPAGVPIAVTISGGWSHTCARHSSGQLHCWGRNEYGELGSGSTSMAITRAATPVAGAVMVVDVSARAEHTCYVTVSGRLHCFGRNDTGQIGDGTMAPSRPTPSEVVGLPETVTRVSIGGGFTCARLASGTVACWGQNDSGQLGNRSTGPSLMPVSVTGLSDVTDLDSNAAHSCAIHAVGSVSCWGSNNEGQIGNGTTVNALGPTIVDGIDGAVDVATGGRHSCAAIASGVRCWGWGINGQLGNGMESSPRPVSVGGLPSERVVQVAAGALHSCALLQEGTAYCWGLNDFGQLGDGTTKNRSSAQPVRGLEGLVITEIRCGDRYTCARVEGGDAYCWGYNGHGGLGNGTTEPSSMPVAVVDL